MVYRTTGFVYDTPQQTYEEAISGSDIVSVNQVRIQNKTNTSFDYDFGAGLITLTRDETLDLINGETAKAVYLCYYDSTNDHYVYLKSPIPSSGGMVTVFAKQGYGQASSISELGTYSGELEINGDVYDLFVYGDGSQEDTTGSFSHAPGKDLVRPGNVTDR